MAVNLSKSRRAEIEAKSWALSQKCWSQARIAEHLGVDQGTVSRALSRVRSRALARLDDDARTWLVTLLEQLEHVSDEAIQAWERSKRPKKRATRKTSSDPNGDSAPGGAQTSTEVVEREGEPAYLAAYYHAIDRIRALLALDSRVRPPPDPAGESDTPTVRDALAEAIEADAAYVPDPPDGGEPLPSPSPA